MDIAASKEEMESSSSRLRRFVTSIASLPPASPRSTRWAASARSYARHLSSTGSFLSPHRRKRARPLLDEISRLEQLYARALAREKKFVFFRSASSLSGLTAHHVKACRAQALAMGRAGWALPLDDTVDQDVNLMLTRPATRARVLRASRSRGSRVSRIARKIALTRRRAAIFMGSPDWASVRMSRLASACSASVWKMLLRQMASLSRAPSPSPTTPSLGIPPSFLPYAVLERGCFYAARKFFGLRVSRIRGVALYHPSVRLYRVASSSGCLGFITADLSSRPGKSDGAWASCWEDSESSQSYPVVGIFCNLGQRCSFSGVGDIFHEFGHALHALLSSRRPVFSSALSMPNDLLEVPSMLAETWILDPSVYSRIRTPSSPSHAEVKLLSSSPRKTTDRIGDILSAATDLVWHGSSIPTTDIGIRNSVNKRLGIPAGSPFSPTYSENMFPHIFCSDYDASYFSYLWCEEQATQIELWMAPKGRVQPRRARQFASLLKKGADMRSTSFTAPLGLASPQGY